MSHYVTQTINNKDHVMLGNIPARMSMLRELFERLEREGIGGFKVKVGSRKAGTIDMGADGVMRRPLSAQTRHARTRTLHELYVQAYALINTALWLRQASSQSIGEQGIAAVQNWIEHSAAASYHIINQGNYSNELQDYALGIMRQMLGYENGVQYLYGRYLLMLSNGFAATRVNWARVQITPSTERNPSQIYLDWLVYNEDKREIERTTEPNTLNGRFNYS